MTQKFDKSKYEISKDMPEHFAQVIPGIGVQHFHKDHLTENDLKALALAKNPFVKAVGEEPGDKPGIKPLENTYQQDTPVYKEDKPK